MPTGHGRGPVSPFAFYNRSQNIQVRVSGITRDSTGVVLANCDVHLFRTSDDLEIDQTTSDANGYYEFRSAIPVEQYYAVAYKVGAPDVAGTTVKTLVGA
jgi:hypothetical protein